MSDIRIPSETPGVKVDSPPPDSPMASQLVCFRVHDRDKHAKLQEQFAKDKVIARAIGVNGTDYRLSVHLYNKATISNASPKPAIAIGLNTAPFDS